jgi:hypothetical protein
MKRNLMNELKEGMNALTSNMKVYLVIGHSNIYGSDVHGVHQTKESAEMQQQFLEESDNKEEGRFYLVEVFEVENIK